MKKTYPCTFPIYLKDGSVVRCWVCKNCNKFTKYLTSVFKKESKIYLHNYFTTQPELWSK